MLDLILATVALAVLLAAFAVERVLTLVVLTPGGAGLAETGTVGVLVAFGVDPASAVAGVLLYRLFTFALEIPVGGAAALGWLLTRPSEARTSVAGLSVAGPSVAR